MSTKTVRAKKGEKTSSAPRTLKARRPPTTPRKKAIRKKTTPGRSVRGVRRVTRVVSAEPHKSFWVNFGPVVTTLEELAQALRDMSDDQFYFHTRDHGNDFAAWVRDVFSEDELARKLLYAKSRMGAYRVVAGFVALPRA